MSTWSALRQIMLKLSLRCGAREWLHGIGASIRTSGSQSDVLYLAGKGGHGILPLKGATLTYSTTSARSSAFPNLCDRLFSTFSRAGERSFTMVALCVFVHVDSVELEQSSGS